MRVKVLGLAPNKVGNDGYIYQYPHINNPSTNNDNLTIQKQSMRNHSTCQSSESLDEVDAKAMNRIGPTATSNEDTIYLAQYRITNINCKVLPEKIHDAVGDSMENIEQYSVIARRYQKMDTWLPQSVFEVLLQHLRSR